MKGINMSEAETVGDILDKSRNEVHNITGGAELHRRRLQEAIEDKDRLEARYLSLKEKTAEAKKDWEAAKKTIIRIGEDFAFPERNAPLFAGAEQAREESHQAVQAADSRAKEKPAAGEPGHDPEAWRDIALDALVKDHSFPPNVVTKLAELRPPIRTLGDLVAWQQRHNELQDLKGVGQAVAGKAEDAIDAWMKANPDKRPPVKEAEVEKVAKSTGKPEAEAKAALEDGDPDRLLDETKPVKKKAGKKKSSKKTSSKKKPVKGGLD